MKTRKRRTGLLFSSAVILGLLGGAGTGYAIQQHRQPTPLPPLNSVALLAAAPVKDDPASDDMVKLNGDLSKLLLDKPAGAKDWDFNPYPDGWSSLAAIAMNYSPGSLQSTIFTQLNTDGFRRVAGRVWTTSDGLEIEVRLLQFQTTAGAASYAGLPGSGETSLDGTENGAVYISPTKDTDGYTAACRAQHGTVLMEIYVYQSKNPVPAAEITALAKQQLAKL